MIASSARHDPADVWRRYTPRGASFADLGSRIHVWRIGLDSVQGVGDNLSDDERARAGRLARAEDRRRFIATRSVLRAILADLLDLDQEPRGGALRFGYGTAGKPCLIDDPRLEFNVSHSGDLAMIAATRAGAVGIDIERQQPIDDMDAVIRLAFNDAERTAMLGCPPDGREAVFYRIWTRKEALLKAMGTGLPALSDPDAASLASAGRAFLVTTLPHVEGYVAALARPRTAHGLKLWSWPTSLDSRGVERRAWPRPVAPVKAPFAALLPAGDRR